MSVKINELKETAKKLAEHIDVINGLSDMEARVEYHKWYPASAEIVRKISPNLYKDFESSHNLVQDYLNKPITDFQQRQRHKTYKDNLLSLKGMMLGIDGLVDVKLQDITALVTSDLVEDEISEAKLMLEHGFIRCSGAITGVMLETHLKLLHKQLNKTWEQGDGIVKLAERLRKSTDQFTLGDEKKCIAMADTRNKCDHKKDEEPTFDEVSEFIGDVDRFIKRVQVI